MIDPEESKYGMHDHLTWRTSEEQLSTRTSLVSARSLRQARGVMAQEKRKPLLQNHEKGGFLAFGTLWNIAGTLRFKRGTEMIGR